MQLIEHSGLERELETTEGESSLRQTDVLPLIAPRTRKLICQWIPTGKSYPKMVAQWSEQE